MVSLLGIPIGDLIDPAEVLLDRGWVSRGEPEVILRRQLQQGFEFLMDGRQVFFLQDNQVFPAILLTAGERRAPRKEPIQDETEGQAREALLETLHQTIKGLEFAILLGRGFPGILDELGQQREDKAIGRDELGFQHGMIVDRLPVMLHGQAVRAMPLWEGQHSRPVDRNQVVLAEQAIGIQHFLADQGLDQGGDDVLDLGGIQAGIERVQRVAVRTGLDAEEGLELGGERPIVAKELGDLASGAQAAHKHQHARSDQHRPAGRMMYSGLRGSVTD